MIRIIPFDERDEANKREILRAYLKLLAKGTRFRSTELTELFVKKFGFPEEETKSIIADMRKKAREKSWMKFPIGDVCEYLYPNGKFDVDRLYDLLTVPMIPEIWKKRGINIKPKENSSIANFFGYENRVSGSREMYEFTEAMRVPVCPYCNRIFTSTITDEENKTVIRPQIDHFFSKSKYPFFSMSIMNWIPSCPICNQKKSDKNEQILYPYLEEVGDNCTFETRCVSADKGNFIVGQENSEGSFEIVCEIDENASDTTAYAPLVKRLSAVGCNTENVKKDYVKRLHNSKDMFGWETVAQSHKTYVLRMYRREFVFGRDYQASLERSFHELFTDESLTYLRSIKRENWGEAPIAKLSHDIDREIKDIR